MKYIPLSDGDGYQILLDAQSPTCYTATVVTSDGDVALHSQGGGVQATDNTAMTAVARCAIKFGGLRERGLI